MLRTRLPLCRREARKKCKYHKKYRESPLILYCAESRIHNCLQTSRSIHALGKSWRGFPRTAFRSIFAISFQHIAWPLCPTHVKLSSYAKLLERLPHFWADFAADSPLSGGAHRAHQLQSASQRVPHATQAAAFLPNVQPHGRTLGSREGLRIRKRPIRSFHRRRTEKCRAGVGAQHGNSGI